MENIKTLLDYIEDLKEEIKYLKIELCQKRKLIEALEDELLMSDIDKIKNQYTFESTIVDMANGKEFLHTNYVHTFAELINEHGYDRVVEKLTELAHAHTPQEEPVNAEPDDDLPFEIDTD